MADLSSSSAFVSSFPEMLTRGAVGDDLSSYILTTHAGDPDQVPNLWLWSDTAATVSGDKESVNLPVSALIKQNFRVTCLC